MAMANTITAGFIFKNEGKETDVTPVKWNIIQTVGTWTNVDPGNQDIVSDLSSGAYEVRLLALTVSITPGATSGAVAITAARNTFGLLTPGTTTNAAVNGCWNFGPVGMLVDITSTTACVAAVTAATQSGYFYCQFAKRAK